MSKNITIPVIEIDKGWTVDEVLTIEDCTDAHALLISIIARIELQIDEMKEYGETGSHQYRKAKAALKFKKAALNIVNSRRGEINRADREAALARFEEFFEKYVHTNHPEILKDARAAFRATALAHVYSPDGKFRGANT